ncbi:MAG: hypothetical protein KJZ86_05045 [Caldilineaceae bacterium]|nr:hypothetical protein [Caldilineaceae bacterium]
MAEQTEQENLSTAYTLATRGVTAQPAKRTSLPSIPRGPEVEVALVADFHRRFPGEALFLFVRLQPSVNLPICGLEVRIPEGLLLVDCDCLDGDGPTRPNTRSIEGEFYLSFDFEGGVVPGMSYEYVLETIVQPAPGDRNVEVGAVVLARTVADGPVIRDEESLAIAVSAKGNYTRYLPSLYTRDELMGRFLMLFESFWSPVSQQIRQMPYYFDPTVTPADMLPWLASWLDLTLDPEWPEAQRRALLKAARRLYQKRGTARGLQEYLEIYTGGQVQIIEHRANNFVVGSLAELSDSIALGRNNRPHTFTVIVHLPGHLLADEGRTAHWQQRIAAIIDSEKPVHTTYTLRVEAGED